MDGAGERVRVLGTAMWWTWSGIQVGDAVVTGAVFEELAAETGVFGTRGCCLAVVAALGDVVKDAWGDQVRVAWQTSMVRNSVQKFSGVWRNCGEVPLEYEG